MLKTTPVGAPPVPNRSARLGIETTRPCGVPVVSYRVDTPALLSEIQKGEVGDSPIPQGFTRFGSKNWAIWVTPWLSTRVGTVPTFLLTTRSVSAYPPVCAGVIKGKEKPISAASANGR